MGLMGFDKGRQSYICMLSAEVSRKTTFKRLSANKVAKAKLSPYFRMNSFALAVA